MDEQTLQQLLTNPGNYDWICKFEIFRSNEKSNSLMEIQNVDRIRITDANYIIWMSESNV